MARALGMAACCAVALGAFIVVSPAEGAQKRQNDSRAALEIDGGERIAMARPRPAAVVVLVEAPYDPFAEPAVDCQGNARRVVAKAPGRPSARFRSLRSVASASTKELASSKPQASVRYCPPAPR